MYEFIKKLIERLEEELGLADEVKEKCAIENPFMFYNAKGYSTGVSNSIYIVNQLAEKYNNDFCEGERNYRFISDKYKVETGCGYTFYDLHHAEPFKYCPYCGKNIKVIECSNSEIPNKSQDPLIGESVDMDKDGNSIPYEGGWD